ncbi:MAG: hypothetical protein Q4F11_05620 [Eubacteriales bacterium]|nr:hypothetical protein [Eubacteriales bacterium]
MKIAKYLMNREWKAEVDRQIMLEKKITRHISEYYVGIFIGLCSVFAALAAIVPGDVMYYKKEGLFLVLFVFTEGASIALYVNSFLQVMENGRRVNIFTKYKNVPVNINLLITAKLVLLTKRSFICAAIYQGINFFVRLAWFSLTGSRHWSVLNLWPMAAVSIIYIAEYLRITVYAGRCCK